MFYEPKIDHTNIVLHSVLKKQNPQTNNHKSFHSETQYVLYIIKIDHIQQ